MYEQQQTSSQRGGVGAGQAALAGPKVGGSTLVQKLAVDAPVRAKAQAQQPAAEPAAEPAADPAGEAMFAGASPAWETIDPAEVAEPPRPPVSAHAAPRAEAAAAGPESVPATPTADALPVTREAATPATSAAPAAPATAAHAPADPLHIGGKTDAHGGPFERELGTKHHDQHAAALDAYNRGTVHSDKASAHVFGRPGAVSHGHGIFQLKKDATRYTYTAQGKTNVAVPFDVIAKDKLESINPVASHESAKDKATHKKEVAEGKTVRLALNPSTPRQLQIDGVETWCVLSWADGFGGGAAWLPVKDLAGNTSQIRHDVAARAKKEDPSTALSPSTRYVVRDDAIGQADAKDLERKGRVLAAGAHGGDNVSHYLEKDSSKPEFKDGKKDGHNVQRGFVAVCMNLPEGRTPPVADDTALAGESFFAFNDAKFHREVAVYENGAKSSHRRQTWVFGHLGKTKGGSGADAADMQPDPNRAGWVPLRVLKLA
ncbi:MAG TPA: hypothetical protein VH165_22990 [Kofleriaceae bacterium]|nr:hypothetical protein [Kofleriaceae bacterium]